FQRACFKPGVAVVHRLAVAAPDTADPAGPGAAVSSLGYQRVRFDVDTSLSEGLTGLTLQPLLWNATAGRFFAGPTVARTSSDLGGGPASGRGGETGGAEAVCLKVAAATAPALAVDIFATPWEVRRQWAAAPKGARACCERRARMTLAEWVDALNGRIKD